MFILHRIAEWVRKLIDPLPIGTKVTITYGKYYGKSAKVVGYSRFSSYQVRINSVGDRSFKRKFLKKRKD